MTCVLEVKEQYIHAAIIHNPLEPMSSRKSVELVWDYQKTLYDYIYDLPEDCKWTIIYGGQQVTLEETKNIKPMPDTYLVVAPDLLGGGGGGGKGGSLALVALMVVAACFIGPAAFAFFGTLGAGGSLGAAAAIGAGVASGSAAMVSFAVGSTAFWVGLAGATAVCVGSAMLVQKLIAPKQIKEGPKAGSADSYGNDSTKPSAQEGSMLGVVYGEYRNGGVIIQNKTVNSGSNQTMYVLQALSEGEVESISDIQINEVSVDTYSGVENQIRLGTDNQELIPWFDDSYNVRSQNSTLTDTWVAIRTSGNIDKFSIDVSFPLGLYVSAQTDERTIEAPASVGIQVQYKKVTDTEWRNIAGETRGYINNITSIVSGDIWKFKTPNGEYDREIRFDNIIYKDYLVDDSTKTIYYYVKVENNIVDTLNNFKKIFAQDTDGMVAPDLSVNYEVYSGGLYRVIFEPKYFNYDFYVWQIETVGQQCGTPVSFTESDSKNVHTITGFSKSAVRRVIESGLLNRGIYEIRVRRTNKEGDPNFNPATMDQAVWVDTNEIIVDDITYNHTALLATKVKMSGQITSTPAVTAIVKGVKLKKYDYNGEVVATEWSNNPAWVALDILTNTRYGGGVKLERIDIPKFVEWAEFCEQENLTFNGYIYSDSNIWDTLNLVCTSNHATVVFCGTKITLAIDRKEEPIYLFNGSNIIEGTFSTDWSGVKDRPNSFELSFNNKNNGYVEQTLKVIDTDYVEQAGDLNTLSVTAVGITDEERATRELKRYILKNKYQRQTVTFSAPIEAVGCTIGDVIVVQHDVPQWGYGGKLEAGCTKSVLQLDRPIVMDTDKKYQVMIKHDAAKIYDTQAMVVVNKSIFVAGKIERTIKRLIVNGNDVEVVKVISGSPYSEIIVRESNICSVGDRVELWSTDVLEERDVVTDARGELTEIQLQKEMEFEPKQYDAWLFGYKDSYQKKFKVDKMEGLNTEQIKIVASEYNDAAYDLDNYEGEEPNISMIDLIPQVVRDLKGEEVLVKFGNAYSTNLTVSWSTEYSTTYYGADIYVRYSDTQPFIKIGQAEGGMNYYTLTGMSDNQYLEIKVVAYDGLGRRASFNESPILQYTIVGKNKAPITPTGFEIRKTSQGLMLAWNIVNEADVTGYIIKQGTEWISGTVVDDNVSNNRYTIQYTEAGVKNFMVKAKDAFGNESELPAYASITLDPPLDPIDFMSVQNNDFIVLKWNNLDDSVVKFRIKEGESWGSGTIVADVSGYSHSVPINGYYNRKFWIKSIDQFGVFCANAVYTSPMAIEHQTKNVIVEYPESDNGFIHPRLNFDLINDDLIVRENKKYGEYSWYVGLGEKLYARVISEDEVDAIAHSPKWKDFKVRWNAFEAQSPWVVKASLDNVQIERQMALPTDKAPADVLESFSYFMTPDGEYANTQPIIPMNFEYSNGRFREGIVVDDTVSLGYNINIPAIFSLRFWVRPKLLVTSGYINILNPLEGHFLRLYYNSTTRAFILKDYLGQEISATTDFVEDEPILIGISQSATTRSLMVGFSNDLKVVTSSKELEPLGDFTQFYFR